MPDPAHRDPAHPTQAELRALFTELLGTTTPPLDFANPVDYLFAELARALARHRVAARQAAADLTTELRRVADDGLPSGLLADATGPRRYDAAVAAIRALATPVHMATSFYRDAHPTAPDRAAAHDTERT